MGINLSTALVFSSFNTKASAEENSTNNVQEELSEFAEQTNSLEIVNIEEVPTDAPIISFDSVEDFQQAVNEMERDALIEETFAEEEIFAETTVFEKPAPSVRLLATATAVKNGSARITWNPMSWNPLHQLILPTSMWIDFSYTYTGTGSTRKFTKITSIVASSNGTPSTWHKTTAPISSFYDLNKGVSITIQGYHLLGVSIGGQPIGARFADTFTKKYHF